MHPFHIYRTLALAGFFGLGALATGCLGDSGNKSPNVDSSSHFLSVCVDNADCAANLSCICNVCTLSCTAAAACTTLSAEAICVPRTTDGVCPGAVAPGDFCGLECGPANACQTGSDCRNGLCVKGIACRQGTTWDPDAGYCATPWTDIDTFTGNQACGPEYYEIALPFGMNEFRPRAPSSVTGGFLATVTTLDQTTLWSFSPNGETSVCNNLWGDVQGDWSAGIRRTAGPTEAACAAPISPPPEGHYLRGCGIYSFSIQGRGLVTPDP